MANVYFAKVNINERINEVYKNKLNLETLLINLYEKINNNTKIGDKKNDKAYKFANLNKDEKTQTIFGYLVKVYKNHTVDVFDEQNNSLHEENLRNYSEGIAFSFNVKKEIISFVPNKYFTKEKFIVIFKKMLEASYKEMGYINITLLIDNENFEMKFSKIDRLGRFSVVLVPPNDAKDVFEEMDDNIDSIIEYMKNTGATYYRQELSTDVRNPMEKDSYLIRTFETLAKSGYGHIEAYGKSKENENVKINTRNDRDMHKTKFINDKLKNSPYEIMSISEDLENDKER
ncbi:hypothetical protein [Staphylococcus epidermidis]|uniref:hypothetical protein n=1 Tax=Staphylococcus epidermidis TaxID=1282 RepID=UPI00193137BC|nr:hypothetical protein [Staphylococcus epidermidis]MBM0870229.1 hypothetical protein [Staphylococcus epidermidis]MBM6268631.1 hypothetical protein [Staphylococcus epidermidis]MCO6219843.1 hypothetical protein [Staphylococcus epidermidis]MCO6291950.1 hypothetical protein [Staphylococcus epidermidis]MCO6300335.1 hypothetical protein [Staphylococcus epidermidis]